MGMEYVRGRYKFISEVEDWMREQWSTEVFNFSVIPVTQDEMKITTILDRMLYDIVFGDAGIDETVAKARTQPNKLIQGRRPAKREQSFGSWQGSTYDGMFKDRLHQALETGDLNGFKGKLTPVPAGSAGPDVYLTGTPMIAWDVTTQADIESHILRDSIRRLYDRYYLLIWDEPRTKPATLLRALARGQHT